MNKIFKNYIMKSRETFKHGTVDWNRYSFPHVPRPEAAVWFERNDYKLKCLNISDDLLEVLSYVKNKGQTTMHHTATAIVYAALAEACAVCTSKHVSSWIYSEFVIDNVPGVYALLKVSAINTSAIHYSTALLEPLYNRHLMATIDPVEGATLWNKYTIENTNARIIYGTKINCSVSNLRYEVDESVQVVKLPLSSNERYALQIVLRQYVDDLRKNHAAVLQFLMRTETKRMKKDVSHCMTRFFEIMERNICRLFHGHVM
ncbi:hypothetical protein [Heliothis virescens ascovirus 3g]|uniref:Uncharacterized protein n=1 Tax=Heliothis virescens ascovirus 3g TaxID=1246651 RepID=K4P932_9VIRU|nr:hypothetical protein F8204_gp002 [Heliothis virescens ascovirus 3g]AFV50254.1 hypothetical protein [Heliothis virescens ascovirus 3g]